MRWSVVGRIYNTPITMMSVLAGRARDNPTLVKLVQHPGQSQISPSNEPSARVFLLKGLKQGDSDTVISLRSSSRLSQRLWNDRAITTTTIVW